MRAIVLSELIDSMLIMGYRNIRFFPVPYEGSIAYRFIYEYIHYCENVLCTGLYDEYGVYIDEIPF